MARKVKQPGRGYAGREKKKLFLYNEKGEYIKTYNSISECRKEQFPNDLGKRPIIDKTKMRRAKYGYHKLDNNYFIADHRIGRENLRKFEAINSCDFCQKLKKDTPIKVLNLLDEEIATFTSINIAAKMTGVDKEMIRAQCKSGETKVKLTKTKLRFKYAK